MLKLVKLQRLVNIYSPAKFENFVLSLYYAREFASLSAQKCGAFSRA
jgi:hypothetical protein